MLVNLTKKQLKRIRRQRNDKSIILKHKRLLLSTTLIAVTC